MTHRKIWRSAGGIGTSVIGLALLVGLFACQQEEASPRSELPLTLRSASELARAIRSREVTAAELLELYVDRIERLGPSVNAVVAMDLDAARARAAEADRATLAGESWGPLHGLPVTVKDAFAVAHMTSTGGDPKLAEYRPESSAVAVQRLIDAGAIVFGKTNVPYRSTRLQTYNDIYGVTNNPWDTRRSTGGSSGGSAAAISAGFSALELGSDWVGSIRSPSHFCGVYGHRPTTGVVPLLGHMPPMPGQPQVDMPMLTAGPIARSAGDLALALGVLTTSSTDAPPRLRPRITRELTEYRVAAWFDPPVRGELDRKVRRRLDALVDQLERAGVDIQTTDLPRILKVETNELFSEAAGFIIAGKPIPPRLLDRQEAVQAEWERFFEGFDVLLLPAALTTAFPHDHAEPFTRQMLEVNGRAQPIVGAFPWTLMPTVGGLPVTVAPVGLDSTGLPVGIQIVGARFDDYTTIDFAERIATVAGGYRPPPGYAD